MNQLPFAPGIYEDVPEMTYHALPYCSNSRLSLLKRSPAHLRAALDTPPEQTDAMRLGTAIHAAVLEPEKFGTVYTVAGACEAELKSGDRKGQPCGNKGIARHGGQWFCGKHPQVSAPDLVTALSVDDYTACQGIRESIVRHPRLRKLFAVEGRNELTVIWDDAETGVRCKARIDRLVTEFGGVVLDLKKTPDAREDAFIKKVFSFGYYRQLGFYQDGLAAHGITMGHLLFAAMEADRPYAVCGYRLSDGAADVGREETRRLLKVYAECERTLHWPAYSEEITEISLPNYAWDKIESEAA